MISAWASGTGAAGVTGALAYAALTLCGITSEITLLIMLIVPVVQLFTFCFILREPSRFEPSLSTATSTTSLIDHSTVERDTSLVQSSLTFSQKVQYLPKMLKYVLPLFAVYLSEYFINQGLVSWNKVRIYNFFKVLFTLMLFIYSWIWYTIRTSDWTILINIVGSRWLIKSEFSYLVHR